MVLTRLTENSSSGALTSPPASTRLSSASASTVTDEALALLLSSSRVLGDTICNEESKPRRAFTELMRKLSCTYSTLSWPAVSCAASRRLKREIVCMTSLVSAVLLELERSAAAAEAEIASSTPLACS